jgi:hypothetical protein
MKRRLIRIAALVLLTFALQAIHSPAARGLQQMRALKCCAENCDHPQSFTAASRCGCCQIAAAPDSTSFATSAKTQLSTPGVALIANIHDVVTAPLAPSISSASTVSPRAAPVFLLTLNIRL